MNKARAKLLQLKSLGTLFKLSLIYAKTKREYSIALASKKCLVGQIQQINWLDATFRNLFLGKITYLYKTDSREMVPTIPEGQQILLIRKLSYQYARSRWLLGQVSVGDVVLVWSPLNPASCLVRRLAALGGQETVSAKDDQTFVIRDGQCWLLADNQNLKPEEANDSHTWGPISMNNIMGRVIYRFQTVRNHGLVKNSNENALADQAVCLFELELSEMEKSSKA